MKKDSLMSRKSTVGRVRGLFMSEYVNTRQLICGTLNENWMSKE